MVPLTCETLMSPAPAHRQGCCEAQWCSAVAGRARSCVVKHGAGDELLGIGFSVHANLCKRRGTVLLPRYKLWHARQSPGVDKAVKRMRCGRNCAGAMQPAAVFACAVNMIIIGFCLWF